MTPSAACSSDDSQRSDSVALADRLTRAGPASAPPLSLLAAAYRSEHKPAPASRVVTPGPRRLAAPGSVGLAIEPMAASDSRSPGACERFLSRSRHSAQTGEKTPHTSEIVARTYPQAISASTTPNEPKRLPSEFSEGAKNNGDTAVAPPITIVARSAPGSRARRPTPPVLLTVVRASSRASVRTGPRRHECLAFRRDPSR